MHPEFVPVASIAAASLLLPLPWHWRAGNVATLAIIFWLFISNVIYAIDAAVWGESIDIVIPVWCDITTKIIIGANVALPAACLCICIHLEQVASVRHARTSIVDKQRRQIFEALMCFALPATIMALHYIVQGHRFDIIEEYGCRPATYFSIASIFIVWIPPLLLAIAALVFASLALRHFMLRRVTFAAHLNSSSALTTSRYLRLMLMSGMQMIWTISVTTYALWFTTISIPIRPWTTWDKVHSDFSRIDQFITAFTPPIVVTGYYVLWWTVPISTFLFVAFFAFGRDAVEEYKKCFKWLSWRGPTRVPLPSHEKASGPNFLPQHRCSITKSSQLAAPYTCQPQPKDCSPPGSIHSFFQSSNYDSHSETKHIASISPPEPSISGSSSDQSTIVVSSNSPTSATYLCPPSPLTPPPSWLPLTTSNKHPS